MDRNPADMGFNETPSNVPADVLSQLAAQVAAAKADAEAQADNPITIADVAAAAFVALETIVNILGDKGQQVIDQFEARAATFRQAFEDAE